MSAPQNGNSGSFTFTKEELETMASLGRRALAIKLFQGKEKVAQILREFVDPDSRLSGRTKAIEEAVEALYGDLQKFGLTDEEAVNQTVRLANRTLASVVDSLLQKTKPAVAVKTEPGTATR